MKPELTNELKKLFFAQHYGQIIAVVTKGSYTHPLGTIYVVNGQILSSVGSESYSKHRYSLLLKPLSAISDEDAIEAAKLQGWGKSIYEKVLAKDVHFDQQDEFSVCFYPSSHDNYEVVNYKSYQYLQSKGYALPFMGYSVEELAQAGWVKLQEGVNA